jgi:transcriptional regulator with XRE-family HTH domain
MREAAGLTGNELAARLGWGAKSGPPKISKIENGRQMPTANDIRTWATATGQGEQIPELLEMLADLQSVHTRKRITRPGGVQLQDDYDQRIRAATHIRNMEIAIIPGLLQTAPYTRSVMTQVSAVYGSMDVDAAVQARMQRQEVLYDSSKTFAFLTTEAALRLMPCPAHVMLGQLDRLLSLELLDNVTLGVIPFGELSMTPVNGFLLLDDQLIIETYSGEDREHGTESAVHSRIFDMLMANALTGKESRRLITAVAEELQDQRLHL